MLHFNCLYSKFQMFTCIGLGFVVISMRYIHASKGLLRVYSTVRLSHWIKNVLAIVWDSVAYSVALMGINITSSHKALILSFTLIHKQI